MLTALAAYLLIISCAVALSMLLSPLNVFFRDVGQVLPQVLTFWMLLTPIFFDRTQLRSDLGGWLALNPMTGLIEALRDGLLHNRNDFSALTIPALITFVLLALAVLSSRRFLRQIEDFL